jgi:integrase/recombinase XerD
MHDLDMGTQGLRVQLNVEQAAEIWLAQYSSPNTRLAYAADLRTFLGSLNDPSAALAATPTQLARYRREREAAGRSEATISRQFAALRAFYTTLCSLGVRSDNPLGTRGTAVGESSDTVVLTREEVARLYDAAMLDPRTGVLVHLLLGEGLRLGEVLEIDHDDVSGSAAAKRVRVRRHGRSLTFELGPGGSRSIARLQRASTAGSGPLLTGPDRGSAGPLRLTRYGADHLLKRAAERAHIERRVSANVLRRTHVSNAQRAGVHIEDIRHRMGHRDVRTTRRYLAPQRHALDEPSGEITE